MESEPEVLFDLAAEMDAVLHSQEVARKLGANLQGQRVLGWMYKWIGNLPNNAVKELIDIVTKDQ